MRYITTCAGQSGTQVAYSTQTSTLLCKTLTDGMQTTVGDESVGFGKHAMPLHLALASEAVLMTLGLPSVSSSRRRGRLGLMFLVKMPDLTLFSTW